LWYETPKINKNAVLLPISARGITEKCQFLSGHMNDVYVIAPCSCARQVLPRRHQPRRDILATTDAAEYKSHIDLGAII
jgi:hypothetical protein